jgi:hypothetical protein
MLRHRTLAELAQDAIERIATVTAGASVRPLCASEFAQVVESIRHLDTFPAVLVLPVAGEYESRSAWRRRADTVNLLVVGEWSADVAGSDTVVWELAEAIARRFLPGGDDDAAVPSDTHSSQNVELHGVVYSPVSLRPVAVGEDRTALNLLLSAINPMQDFDE